MKTLQLTPAEFAYLAQLLDCTISDYSKALHRLRATYRDSEQHFNATNVAPLLESWRSQAADLRERIAVTQ